MVITERQFRTFAVGTSTVRTCPEFEKMVSSFETQQVR